MTAKKISTTFALLLLVLLGGFVISKPHWLMPYGRAACDGQVVAGARVYHSQHGDIFLYAPTLDIQLAVVSPKNRDLGRCNPSAFTPLSSLLFSREADPTVQCTSMWKGGGRGMSNQSTS